MWMATFGIMSRSRSTFTSFVTILPLSRTISRPATESGRSSHVPISIPPYFSVSSRTQNAFASSGFSLILNVGESLCAALIIKPVKSKPGTRNAITEDSLRTTKYFPPCVSVHFSCSYSSV